MARDPRIVIAGGGLAGLCAAQALRTVGMHAEVYEAAPELGEIGAAVNTSPNATRALEAIGLGERIAAVGNRSPGIFTYNMQTGEPLEFQDRRNQPVLEGVPQHYSFHRADLLHVLASDLDPKSIHLGHRLAAIEERGETVRLIFTNGNIVEADLLIAADGVRSVVRRALYGDDNPTYTGQMVWRALLKGSDVPPEIIPNGHIQWVGPGCHFIAYYIRGRELVNIVTQEDTDKWVAEGWSIRGDPDEMRRSFPDPEPRLEKLMSLVTECSKWGLFTRPLTENWGRGRIQMIGDAAHAMLPNAGQGACQAFEDAYILARWLASEDDTIQALSSFRRVRIPRVHAVQRISFANARFKHMRDASVQKELLATGKRSVSGHREWIYKYDPTTEWDKLPTVPELQAVE